MARLVALTTPTPRKPHTSVACCRPKLCSRGRGRLAPRSRRARGHSPASQRVPEAASSISRRSVLSFSGFCTSEVLTKRGSSPSTCHTCARSRPSARDLLHAEKLPRSGQTLAEENDLPPRGAATDRQRRLASGATRHVASVRAPERPDSSTECLAQNVPVCVCVLTNLEGTPVWGRDA